MARSALPSLRRFGRSETGVATLEFAILVPVLLTLIYGVAEYVNAADNRNKVGNLARTLADLTSRNKTGQITPDAMAEIMRSVTPVLAPFPVDRATMQVSAVGINKGETAFVCSVWPKPATLRDVGKASGLVVPTNFKREGARYILAEVTMPYQPLFGTMLGRLMKSAQFSFTWTESVAWPVRGGESLAAGQDAEIVLPSGKACDPKGT